MSYCTNCGTPLEKESNFCYNCGKKQEEIQISSPIEITLDKSSTNILLTASVKTEEGDLKYGKINIKGEWVIQPIYDFLYDKVDFEEGDLIKVKLNQKWGLIDQMGHWVIQPNYTEINEYFDQNSYCRARSLGNGYGLLNKQGEWAVQPIFDILSNEFDVNDYCLARINDKCGFIDRIGNVLIPIIYDNVENFDDKGFCSAKINDKYGFIDRNGNWVISPLFDDVWYKFNKNDYCGAEFDGKWGIINRTGNWLTQPSFDSVGETDDLDYIRVTAGQKWGFIDSTGNVLIPLIYDAVDEFDDKGFCRTKINDQFGFIDRNGNWIIPPVYDELGFNFDNDGFIKAEKKEKWGFIDRKGNWLIQPIFNSVFWFDDEGYCMAEINEKFGFIDRKGNWLISPTYKNEMFGDFIDFFDQNNLAKVKINEKFGLINRKGEFIFDTEHHLLELVEEGLYKISTNNKYGYVDKNCTWIIPPKFDYFKEDPLGGEMIWNDEIEDWSEEDFTGQEYDFEEYFGNLTGNEKIYLGNNIPEKKIKSFAQKNTNIDFFNSSECCVYYDSTIWGKGDDGFAILQNNDGLLYLFINEYGRTAVHYCLGNDDVNLDINKIEYSDKNGLTIHSINPKTLEKYDHNISSFTKKDVTEALYNFLIENTVLFDEDGEDEDEENDDDNDPLGIRVK